MERGGLWNTFVMVARAATLLEAGRRALPELTERLARIAPLVGSEPEAALLEAAYLRAPSANFSGDVLASVPSMLAFRAAPNDLERLGHSDRVITTLRREGLLPHWLGSSLTA
jgi:hypothetical protein